MYNRAARAQHAALLGTALIPGLPERSVSLHSRLTGCEPFFRGQAPSLLAPGLEVFLLPAEVS